MCSENPSLQDPQSPELESSPYLLAFGSSQAIRVSAGLIVTLIVSDWSSLGFLFQELTNLNTVLPTGSAETL